MILCSPICSLKPKDAWLYSLCCLNAVTKQGWPRSRKRSAKISEAESKLSPSKRWSNCWCVVASNVNKNCKFAQYALHFGLLLRNCDIVGRVFCVPKNGFLFGHGISQACSFRRYPLNKAMDAIEFPSEIGAAIYFGARAGQGCISHDFPTQGGAKGQQNHQHRCVGDNQMMRWWRVHFVTYHSSDSEWPLTRNRTFLQSKESISSSMVVLYRLHWLCQENIVQWRDQGIPWVEKLHKHWSSHCTF